MADSMRRPGNCFITDFSPASRCLRPAFNRTSIAARKLLVMVNAREVHAAAEHQLLLNRPLKPMTPLLHIAVLVAMPAGVFSLSRSKKTHQALVTIRELNRIADVVDRRRKPVGAMTLWHFFQLPQRVCKPSLGSRSSLKKTPSCSPIRVGEHELLNRVRETLT